MADRAGWEVLFDWEREVCLEIRPATAFHDLVRQVTQAWLCISDTDKVRYVQIWRRVVSSLAKVRQHHRARQGAQAASAKNGPMLSHRESIQNSLTTLAAMQRLLIQNGNTEAVELLERSLAYSRQMLDENDNESRQIREALGRSTKQDSPPPSRDVADLNRVSTPNPTAALSPEQASKGAQDAHDSSKAGDKSQQGGADDTGLGRHSQSGKRLQDRPADLPSANAQPSLPDYESDGRNNAFQSVQGVRAAEHQPKRFSQLNDQELGALEDRLFAKNAPVALKTYYRNATADGNESPFMQPNRVHRRVLRLMHEHGLDHDWDNEDSIRTLLEKDPRQPEDPPPARFVRPKDLPAAAKNLGFGSPARISGSNWRFIESIGQGGFGHAGLWADEDEDGKFVQVGLFEYVSQSEWKDRTFWSSLDPRIPREADVMGLLSGMKHSWPFVRLLAFSMYQKRARYRLYMPHYVHGDLYNLIRIHNMAAASPTEPNPFISARALWAIFESLAAAASVMAKGGLPGDQLPHDRKTIVHRDFKPGNIFLDVPADPKWPGVPAVKVGDFGLAVPILTRTQQKREELLGKTLEYDNPKDIWCWGSPG
ncbi:hypothetical protein EJ03DRAFT_76932 [Teratosphaeria nubilosa]|uniref:Protein kinase domain-containing protein n=1 Tax=Teratosphaeria nubilosa TaxID=161662 RepID=A0A6G1LBK1_9PEZI|nr:hypothetical protein EJ03DRAFT_76932 [Teratosphaeria nubilosa]